MGARSYLVTKHVTEYGGSTFFNYDLESVEEYLSDNDIDVSGWHVGDFCCGCGYYIEIDAAESNLQKLRELIDRLREQPDAVSGVDGEINNGYVAEALTYWLENYDKDNDVIRVEQF